MNRKLIAVAAIGATLLVAGCTSEAADVDKNLTKDADNFKVARRVVFTNGITDRELLTVEGFCSVDPGDAVRMSVKCKTDDGKYVKHFLGKSDNVFWTVEQLEPSDTSASHYRFVLRPGSLVPKVDVNKAQ